MRHTGLVRRLPMTVLHDRIPKGWRYLLATHLLAILQQLLGLFSLLKVLNTRL